MDEEVLYEATPPMFRNHPIRFIVALALVPVFGLGILVLLFWYASCKAHKLTIKGNDLRYEVGLLSKKRVEVKLSSVRSTRVHQTLFQRMLGTGDVEIFTAGDSPEAILSGMPNPHKIRELTRT